MGSHPHKSFFRNSALRYSNAVGVDLVMTQSDAKKTPGSRSRKQAMCASNRKTKERSWACCVCKVHGPDIRASHSKNSGKRAYPPEQGNTVSLS